MQDIAGDEFHNGILVDKTLNLLNFLPMILISSLLKKLHVDLVVGTVATPVNTIGSFTAILTNGEVLASASQLTFSIASCGKSHAAVVSGYSPVLRVSVALFVVPFMP